MGVLDNLKKIKTSYNNKNAVSRLARTAVQQGSIETRFLSEYNSFSVSLKEVLEKTLIMDGNTAITISAVDLDGKSENIKYFNYLLQDEDYKSLYHMEMDKATNITFRLKLIDSDEYLESYQEDNTIDKDLKNDIDFFLNN